MPKTIDRPHTSTRARDERLVALIRRVVRAEMEELLGDPDAGLQLRASLKRRLERSRESLRKGKVYSEREIIQELGLDV